MRFGKNDIRRIQKDMRQGRERPMRKLSLILLSLILVAACGAVCMAFCLAYGAFRGVIESAPDIGNINVTPTGFSTFVYDADGRQIAKLVSTDSNRIPVTGDMIPLDLEHAFVAIEDERFYSHSGIDIQGIMRAAVKGVTSGSFSEGASTITQQLLKNNVFTNWTSESFTESVRRKIQEQYLAVELEKNMSKEDILVNYMNTINLGHNTLGVQAASLRYFGKSVSDLTLSECAVIAGITQNPSAFDPIEYPEANAGRREEVLKRMLRLGFIDELQYQDALDDNVYSRIQTVDINTDDEQINTYFIDALTDQVLNDLMEAGYTETQAYTLLYSGGLKIYSTQNSTIQKICDEVCSDPASYPANVQYLLTYRLSVQKSDESMQHYSTAMFEQHFKDKDAMFTLYFNSEEEADAKIEEFKNDVMEAGDEVIAEYKNLVPQPQISLTIEDQHTGYILAMIGGRGAKTASRTLNRATSSKRQPGSTFKVVSTYAPALDAAGMSLADTQVDEPYTYKDGTPVRNWYGESYRGVCTLRKGIEQSLNIVAVKTLTDITPELGYEYLLNFGFTTLVAGEVRSDGKYYSDIQQTLALGGITDGVTNLELNASYATIANDGIYRKPTLYTRITDHDGNLILDATAFPERRVLKSTTAWLLTSAMQDVVTKGTGASVNFGTTAIAGKTGTTSDYNDVWFCGYTNYYTASVWAGCDDNKKLSGDQEKALARTIWRSVMERIHRDLPYSDFTMPEGIVKHTICGLSGKNPLPGLCDGSLSTDYFAIDSIPKESCDVHFSGAICEYTGLPATVLCPFQVPGVVTLTRGGADQHCIHDEAFMASPNAQEVIAAQRAELDAKAAAAAQAQAVDVLQQTTAYLAACEAEYNQAQASGDQAAIDAALAKLTEAQAAYNAALQAVGQGEP